MVLLKQFNEYEQGIIKNSSKFFIHDFNKNIMYSDTGYIAGRRAIIEYIAEVSRNAGTIYTGKW